METKFKLKKEARQFFDVKYHKEIQTLKWWDSIKVHKNLLDEVELCHIDYGHTEKLSKDSSSTSLCGWTQDGKKAEFRFTLKVIDIEHSDYDKVKIAELMDEMQKVCNKYFKRYLEH